jgi:RimJ/RimL family protein N-acetyltransferase
MTVQEIRQNFWDTTLLMRNEVPVLRTDRLLLRPFARADIPALVPLIGAREVAATTLRIPHPYSARDAETFFARLETGDEVRWAITLHPEGSLIGGIGLRLERDHNRAELGYWLGVPYCGKGYTTEAAQGVLRYGFETLGLHRIQASHFSNNPASGAVLRKIGMRHEAHLREHILKWEQHLDLEVYAVLRSEDQP